MKTIMVIAKHKRKFISVDGRLRLLLASIDEEILATMVWLVLTQEGTEMARRYRAKLLELRLSQLKIANLLDKLYNFLRYSLN